jgi:hypothetical protein
MAWNRDSYPVEDTREVQGPTRRDYEIHRHDTDTGRDHSPSRKDFESLGGAGKEYSPSRKTYTQHKADTYSVDTGVEQGPDRYDYNKKKKMEKVEKDRQKQEDIQSTQYWKEKKKEADAAAKKKEREEEARKNRKPPKSKSWLGNRRPGIEMPKQGLHRLGYASRDVGGSLTGAGNDTFGGYGDAFSLGGADTGLGLSIGNKRGKGIDWGLAEGAMRSDGKARGFSGYRDPFASMGGGSAPAKRKRKKRGRPRKTAATRSSGSGIFGFRLGLF